MTWYSLRRPNVWIRQPDAESSTSRIVVAMLKSWLLFARAVSCSPFRRRQSLRPIYFLLLFQTASFNHIGTQKIAGLARNLSSFVFEKSSRVTLTLGQTGTGVKGQNCLPIYHGQYSIDIEFALDIPL